MNSRSQPESKRRHLTEFAQMRRCLYRSVVVVVRGGVERRPSAFQEAALPQVRCTADTRHAIRMRHQCLTTIKSGACGAAGPASAPGSALGRPAQRTPGRTLAASADQHRSHGTHAGTRQGRLPRRTIVPLPAARLGRSLRSRRMRSASPNLDPAATRQGPAPIEADGAEQGYGFAEPGIWPGFVWRHGEPRLCGRG